MNDIAAENEQFADVVSGLFKGALNLSVTPCTDGTVGVIVRPLNMTAPDNG